MISQQSFDKFAYAAMAIGIVSFVVMVVNIYRAAANHKESQEVIANLNLIFTPSELTDRGLAARRWCIWGLAGFVLSWFAVVIGSKLLVE